MALIGPHFQLPTAVLIVYLAFLALVAAGSQGKRTLTFGTVSPSAFAWLVTTFALAITFIDGLFCSQQRSAFVAEVPN